MNENKSADKLVKLEARKWEIAKQMDEQPFSQMSFMVMWAELTQVTLDIYYLESAAEGLTRKQAKERLDNVSKKIDHPQISNFLRTAE